MIVTIHQPEHLPWLGFFDKLRQAQAWVVLDHVQFRKNYYQNRNKMRSADGFIWLTVPVRLTGRYGQAINEVRIDNQTNPRWRAKCWNSLYHCYNKAPFFDHHAPFFESLYRQEWERLVDLNETIIGYLLSALSIELRVIRSSALDVKSTKGELVLDICRQVGATKYLSGISGREHLDQAEFARAGIELEFQQFYHPIYGQLREPFLPGMSVVDLLFNHGPQSPEILKGVGVPRLETVF